MNNAQLFQQMVRQGNNPLFNRAMQMVQGKNEEEIKQIVKNLAQQRGINIDQLSAMANQLGLKL